MEKSYLNGRVEVTHVPNTFVVGVMYSYTAVLGTHDIVFEFGSYSVRFRLLGGNR